MQGHTYYKSSECPTCPVCAAQNKATAGFMESLSAPAQRALITKNITSLKKLAAFTEQEILSLHGMGKASIPKLKAALTKEKLSFKK